MSQRRRTNGQFAPSLTGKKPPVTLTMPQQLDRTKLETQSQQFLASTLQLDNTQIQHLGGDRYLLGGKHEVRVRVQQMVLTDWGRAKGAHPSTHLTLRYPGRFQKDLSQEQIDELRNSLGN